MGDAGRIAEEVEEEEDGDREVNVGRLVHRLAIPSHNWKESRVKFV
jgi:hypothetical protein